MTDEDVLPRPPSAGPAPGWARRAPARRPDSAGGQVTSALLLAAAPVALAVIGGVGFVTPPSQHRYWCSVAKQVRAYSGEVVDRADVESAYARLHTLDGTGCPSAVLTLGVGGTRWAAARLAGRLAPGSAVATPASADSALGGNGAAAATTTAAKRTGTGMSELSRQGLTATRLSNAPGDPRFLVFGGKGGASFSDPKKRTCVAVIAPGGVALERLRFAHGLAPPARSYHSACFAESRGSVVVFGGLGVGGKHLGDLWEWVLSTREWRPLQSYRDIPGARAGHSCVVGPANQMIVFGGEGELGTAGDLSLLDLGSLTWTRVPAKGPAPKARSMHSCVCVGKYMVVFGGRDWEGHLRADLCVLDCESLTWLEVGANVPGIGPCAREAHAAAVHGSTMYLVGGWCGTGDAPWLGDTWRADLSPLFAPPGPGSRGGGGSQSAGPHQARPPAMSALLGCAAPPGNARGEAAVGSSPLPIHIPWARIVTERQVEPSVYGHALVIVDSDPCSAEESTFVVPESVRVGGRLEIVLQARNSAGVARAVGGDRFCAALTALTSDDKAAPRSSQPLLARAPSRRQRPGPGADPIATARSIDLGNGTHLIRVPAPAVGLFCLTVGLFSLDETRVIPVAGSPRTVRVLAGAVSAEKSRVAFAPEEGGFDAETGFAVIRASVGVPRSLALLLRDAAGNTVETVSPNELAVSFSNPDAITGRLVPDSLSDGIGFVELHVREEGTFLMSIKDTAGIQLAGSPLAIRALHSEAHFLSLVSLNIHFVR